jgi:dipeptidyl aminopeptidase/acylaminoacyl peptidase
MPGEEHVAKPELWVYDREAKKIQRVEPKWKDETYRDIHWEKDGTELRFLRRDRLQRSIEICTFNALTHECKCLLMESFDSANLSPQPMRYLTETGEMLWWSERSGWGHYYLYDHDAKLKNAVTSGNWHVASIVAFDAKNRTLYVRGNAREPGESPYYHHLYRVNLDGTNLTLLDPGNADHTSALSPSKQFVIDSCTRIDQAPASVLRDATGRKIMDLEQADLTRLYETGWKMPDSFVVKAADGVTDIYGNMWKPYNFDPTKKYPIIAHVYPGPQTESVTQTFSPTNGNQALAQLGFIVIHVGNRGGSPERSKAYESYGYFNLRDYALADKKSAIEQLAARHPFIDIERVGIYGHSGGGFLSAAAMLQKPYNEFFKVAVASSGNHDNNIYNQNWSEQHHGLREVPANQATADRGTGVGGAAGRGAGGGRGTGGRGGGGRGGRRGGGADDDAAQDQQTQTTDQQQGGQDKKDDQTTTDQEKKDAKPETKFQIHIPTNAELAANLKGHLLLVHGDMDNNVHPANTIRLADALIRANKRFDMLIMPGQPHAYGPYQPYFTQRMWDYFTEHLLNERQTSADIYDKTKANGNGTNGSSNPR